MDDGSALAGLGLILLLYDRLPDASAAPPSWRIVGSQRSDHQPGLIEFGQQFEALERENPTIASALAWISRRFIIGTHESIAYSKLPNFTFRFRWEQGRLRFYSNGIERFNLTDIRRDAMSRITEDIGMWSGSSVGPALTPVGQQFMEAVFS